jgi:hypothetical protein
MVSDREELRPLANERRYSPSGLVGATVDEELDAG